MTREGRFGSKEAISVLTITISAKTFFTSPANVVKIAATAGWYLTLISCLTAMLAFLFIYLLLKRFDGKSLPEINEIVLGRPIGFVFSLLLMLILMLTSTINLREFAEVIKVYVLNESPLVYIMVLFLTGVCVLSILGLESIARMAKLSAFGLMGGFILIVVLAAKDYDLTRLLPLMGHGLDRTIIHGLTRCSAYGEIIILAVIARSVGGARYVKRVGFISLALSGMFVGGGILAFSLFFPYSIGQEMTAPLYQMASQINYGTFFSRMEPIFLFVWVISTLISVCATFYVSLMIYSHIFRIRDNRPLVIPLALIMLGLAVLPKDIIDLVNKYIHTEREYGWTLFFLPSILVFVVALIRRKGVRRGNA